MPRIVVCADDFGYRAGVNAACLQLVEQGRLSALACMSEAPAWSEGATALRERLADGAGQRPDLGLHLNLTESFAPEQWSKPLGSLIMDAYLGRLPRTVIDTAIAKQLDAFEAGLGRAPDFVDGHQHVHQLPLVRELLIEQLKKRYPQQRPWLRNTRPPLRRRGLSVDGLKHRVIASLGAGALSAMARDGHFEQNRGFAGVYPFDGAVVDYQRRLEAWCGELDDGGLLMCHPGQADDAADVIGPARQREFEVLGSAWFGDLMAARGSVVGRLA